MAGGRPPLYTDVEELETLIEAYFESPEVKFTHKETGQVINRPTMSGLAIALDMDRKSLYNYSKKEKFFPTINKARARVEAALEQNLTATRLQGLYST